MRVALIGCTVNPRVGGMGRALYDHAVALAEAGHEVTVYALPPFPDGSHAFTVRPIKYFLRVGKAAWAARFDPPLDAYDVAHLHLPFFGVAERVARWKMSFRASKASREISSVRSLDFGLRRASEPSARDDKKRLFVTYHMDAIGTGLKRVYFNWWYRHRFKRVLAACDAIAVTSRAYARDSQLARAGIYVEKCEEILLRVDTGRFSRSVWDSSAATRPQNDYLLFVGALDRAHYFKGLSILLKAFAETHNAKLVVVGAGELLDQYKKEAAQLGIADRVTFTGGVTDEELARWYAGARAIVLPSTDRSEAFGIVLIEAMACGTPVIASDLSGVREVVQRVQGGVFIAPPTKDRIKLDSNDNLIAALQQMWQQQWSDDERAALAARTAATYGRATLAEQLLKWYNQTNVPS